MIKSIDKMFVRWSEYELLSVAGVGALGFGQPMANLGASAMGGSAPKARRGRALSARATATRNNGGSVGQAIPGDVERFGRLIASETLNHVERALVVLVYVECHSQPRKYCYDLAVERGIAGSAGSVAGMLGGVHRVIYDHESRRKSLAVCGSYAPSSDILSALKGL